ncbi:hypothetical protein BDV19DRAFT_352849 [Aspergillus venezuelensis]
MTGAAVIGCVDVSQSSAWSQEPPPCFPATAPLLPRRLTVTTPAIAPNRPSACVHDRPRLLAPQPSLTPLARSLSF